MEWRVHPPPNRPTHTSERTIPSVLKPTSYFFLTGSGPLLNSVPRVSLQLSLQLMIELITSTSWRVSEVWQPGKRWSGCSLGARVVMMRMRTNIFLFLLSIFLDFIFLFFWISFLFLLSIFLDFIFLFFWISFLFLFWQWRGMWLQSHHISHDIRS